jgi:hypothetical protein
MTGQFLKYIVSVFVAVFILDCIQVAARTNPEMPSPAFSDTVHGLDNHHGELEIKQDTRLNFLNSYWDFRHGPLWLF